MTRIDSVRHAADVTKDSVRHAAEVAAPYASTAKENAVVYGRQAGAYGRQAGTVAKQQYDAKLAPRVGQARDQAWAAVPPKAVNAVETAASAVETAARRTADGARAASDYTVPKVSTAVAATRSVAGPTKDEVVLRGAAALHALRGQVSASEIDRLVRRRIRREKAGRTARDVVLVAVACGAAFAAWKWWSKQNNPEWLVEPSEPTEVDDRASMNGSATLTVVDPLENSASVNGSSARIDQVDGTAAGLDPEVEAKQADADHPRRHEGGGH